MKAADVTSLRMLRRARDRIDRGTPGPPPGRGAPRSAQEGGQFGRPAGEV
jgi:hypothetical protein